MGKSKSTKKNQDVITHREDTIQVRQRRRGELRSAEQDTKLKWWLLALASVVAIISILLVVSWRLASQDANSTHAVHLKMSLSRTEHESKDSAYKVLGNITVKTLPSPDSSFARMCAKGQVPIVLRNSVVRKWKASRWSPKYLKSKMRRISGVYQNDNRWFGPYFDKNKPLVDYAVKINDYRTDVKLSSKEFFKQIEDPTDDGSFFYFTGGIDQLGEWAFDEVQPINELLLLNPKRSSINTWIGQPHVIAHCHYDGYHNFYAQLYGTKKFTLFKPTNWPGLYPYPFLHPSHAQAQVNVSDLNDTTSERFGLVRKTKALEVVLQPGDLLYMPPLWFHHVESQSVSISVNVWTDSRQTELAERIFKLPLPLDAETLGSHGHAHMQWTSDHLRTIAVSVLVYRMLESVCKSRNCLDPNSDTFADFQDESTKKKSMDSQANYFIHRLWNARYRTLMEKGELPFVLLTDSSDGILCERGVGEVNKAAVIEADVVFSNDVHFRTYSEQISQLSRGLTEDTWELWMGNYVEYVVGSVLSDVRYVGLFLKHFSSCTIFLINH